MRVLFFTPMCGRTGSEVSLFNLIRRAVDRGWEVGVVCRTRGELLADLPSQVSIFVYGDWGTLRRLYGGVSRRLGADSGQFLTWVHNQFQPDFWYINTIIMPEVVSQAERLGVSCAVHVHELDQMLEGIMPADAEALVRYPNLVLACSGTARDVLQVLGRSEGLEVSYPTIDPRKISWSDEGSRRVRNELGAGPNTFIWSMAGTLHPNKNPVRFAEAAVELVRGGADVQFLWAGKSDSAYGIYVKRKIDDMGISDRVHLVGERTHDYYDYLAASDGLLVTSFKESFCLAAAEAAYLGKPIVSFNSGGVSEIVRDGMGVVISSWNTSDLVEAMHSVMRGEAGFDPNASRERAREFYIDVQGERWENLLQQYFRREGKAARPVEDVTV